jgi:adenylate kinase family enzyme
MADSVERRFVVVGTSGSGKTVVANRLAQVYNIPHIELDSLFHGPNWTDRSNEAFQALIDEALDNAGSSWVICGNYLERSGCVHWRRATTVVWLDLPKWLVMTRVIRRTLWRLITRTELWNGNREEAKLLFHPEGVIGWAWSTHAKNRSTYAAMQQSDEWSGLEWVRLRSRDEVSHWLANQ